VVDVAELHTTELAEDALAPDGTWSGAPALAASTVAMTNDSEYTVEVCLSGGTWTVLKKNGVTYTGVTSANQGTVPTRFLLKPGDTWALTYSVAPTALQYLFV
jgi:hypothetical protein